VKVFVIPYGSEEIALLANLATSRIEDGATVLFFSPAGKERDKRVEATVGNFEILISIFRDRGVNLVFKDVPIDVQDFLKAVSDIATAIEESQPGDLVVDLSGAVPALSLEVYAATTIYASKVDTEERERIAVKSQTPRSAEPIEVFLPVFTVSRFIPLLQQLDKHPSAKLSELQRLLGKHPSTLSRQIKRAERAGLIFRAGGEYRRTKFGEAVLRVFSDQN
jgi:DNA-binding HxlR family transcriptional regulator